MKRIIIITTCLSIFILPSSFAQSKKYAKNGIYVGLHGGTWFPLSKKNNVLGNPVIGGWTLELKADKGALGISMEGFFNNHTKAPLTIKSGDSIIMRNKYSGAQLTLNYGRQLFEKKRLALEGICSIGIGGINYYTRDTVNIGKESLIISPGLSIRLIDGNTFMNLKIQYCIANYTLKDGISTDVSGHYLTTKLILRVFGR